MSAGVFGQCFPKGGGISEAMLGENDAAGPARQAASITLRVP